jgi:catechol 2,3-dioxygenase-like lactoylglutathione lyase family enzyme
MTVAFNHTICWCRDKQRSATFLAEILGRPAPKSFAQFLVVELDNGASLDFFQQDGDVAFQHYAFLTSEQGFDEIFARIRARELPYWADPARTKPDEINHHDGGRGVYFKDPDGQLLEIITRPYGSGS